MNFTVNLHFVLKEKDIRRKEKEQKTRKKRKDKFNKLKSEFDIYRLNNIVSVQNSLKKNWQQSDKKRQIQETAYHINIVK